MTLLLGTGLGAGWHRTRGAAGQGAPVCRVPPRVAGPGRIGAAHRAEAGVWEGASRFVFRWLADGVPIPGATAADHVPGPACDRRRLTVRVTAQGPGGSRHYDSDNELLITYEPPVAAQNLRPTVLVLHSGEHILDASSDFTGSVLTFGVSGEGVAIDPETGFLTITTDRLRDGVTVTVTATNSGGTATSHFTLTVAAAAPAPGATAPAPVAAPYLVGEPRIGTTVLLEPGTWSGDPVPALAVEWLIDGTPVAGATGTAYAPVAADDGRLLAARVTATNAAGSAEALTAAAAVVYPAPVAAGGLADVVAEAGSGPVTVEAAVDFTGAALVFAAAGAGASIDPATGTLTLATDVARAAETVTVSATNSGGTATSTFAFTVSLPAVLPPAPLAAPALAGTGEIGSPVTVDPGTWEGAPALAVAWLLDGAPIAGATGDTYVPGPADDGRLLAARVTATNAAGSAEAVTAPLPVTHAAPVAAGTLADVAYAAGSGPQIVEAGAAFAGAALVFAVEGPGAAIDAATGRVTLATEAALAGMVTVTATNSGGSASLAFAVTVTAVAAGPVPVGPEHAEIVLLPDLDPEQAGLHLGLRITDPAHPLHPAAGGAAQLAWTDFETEGRDPASQAAKAVRATGFDVPGHANHGVWALTRKINGGTVAWADRSTQIGDSHALAFNWSPDAAGAAAPTWAGWGPRFPAFTITAPAGGEGGVTVVAPALLAAPSLAGTGVIGSPVAVDPGLWAGTPAPALALQWLRNGAPIAGATAAEYLPGPADDRCALACTVTATNAGGSLEAVTAALAVAYAPPRAVGELFDEVFDQGTGVQIVEAAVAFAGEDLNFAVAGASASVEPRTGRVGIPTDAAVAGETVTVTAANSGGSVSLAFLVTVEAAETGLAPLPLAPDQGEIVLLADLDPEQTGLHMGLRITDPAHPLHPAAGGIGHLVWTGLDPAGRDPATQGNRVARPRDFATAGHPHYGVWALTRKINGGTVAWADRSTQIGDSHALAFNWSPDDPADVPIETADWAGWSVPFPTFTITVAGQGGEAPPPAAAPVAGSKRLIIRKEADYQEFLRTDGAFEDGDGHQLMTGGGNCKAHPRFAVFPQDMGGTWNSFDAGRTWWKTPSRGLHNYLINDAVIDPVNPHCYALVTQDNYPSTEGYSGIFFTNDFGITYDFKLYLPNMKGKTRFGGICASEASVVAGRCQRWYGMINECLNTGTDTPGPNINYVRSTDAGESWVRVRSYTHTEYGTIRKALGHPTDVNSFYFASSNGFYRVTNAGGSSPTITRLSGAGGLPAGSYGTINYLALEGGNVVIVLERGGAAYRSTNGGTSWTQILSRSSMKLLLINPYEYQHWISIEDPNLSFSRNGPAGPWTTIDYRTAVEPLPSENGGREFEGRPYSYFFTGPGALVRNRGSQGFTRSSDYGRTWQRSNDGFSGTQIEGNMPNWRKWAANNPDVLALGLTDRAAYVSTTRGDWFRSAPSGLRAHFDNKYWSTFRAMGVHPDYGRGMNRDVIIGLMDRWTKGAPVVCDRLDLALSGWYHPSNVASGTSDSQFAGFDATNGQYAYMVRSRSTGHGKQGTWAVMSAMPSGCEMLDMTWKDTSLSNGQALFAWDANERRKIYRSTNRGDTWQLVLELPSTYPGMGKSGIVRAHPTDHRKLFVQGPSTNGDTVLEEIRVYDLSSGTPTSRPFNRLLNGLPSNLRSTMAPGARFYPRALALDPRFPNVAYLMNNNGGSGHPVIRTTDGGATWESLGGLLPDNRNSSIDVSPHTGDLFYWGGAGGFVIDAPYAQVGGVHDTLSSLGPNRILSTAPAF